MTSASTLSPLPLGAVAALSALGATRLLASSSSTSAPTSRTLAPLAACAAGLGAAVLAGAQQRRKAVEPETKSPKDAGASSIVYQYKLSPVECDEHGRVYGGELLKFFISSSRRLIDVSAGLVAAKHAGGPCLTISVDRVIFMQEIRVGDVISIRAGVNRAWGSSMEIGVKVGRQSRTDPLQAETYCCHAYLTFVAKPTPPPAPSFPLSLTDTLGLTSPPKPRRAKLAEIKPSTLLEQKRYLLAGRRRAHRIQRSKEHDTLLAAFREQVFEIEREQRRASGAQLGEGEEEQDEKLLLQLQLEILTEAYMRQDPDVHVDGEDLVGEVEGYVEPVRVRLADVEKAARKKGHGGWTKIALPTEELVDEASGHQIPASVDANERRTLEVASPLDFADTLVMCLWIVRPQMCNSKNILFGGTLMRWVEEVSSIAARRIYPSASWSSASIDGLTFLTAVQPGEVVYVRAAVLKVYESSIEVACVVFCEDRNAKKPVVRLVSQSFFTMVAIDPQTGRPLKGYLRQVRIPEGTPAAELAAGADKRREDRLLDKQVLQRVYA
ncbi:hypothetical protein JCM8097_002601 [Rhodosporidiobolus ruineniae]